MSCTKAFGSDFGHILYVPNSALGCLYYPVTLLLLHQRYFGLLFLATLVSCIGSLFLAYVLVSMENFCIVCVTIYVVNILMARGSYRAFMPASAKKAA